MIVVDASVVIEVLLQTKAGAAIAPRLANEAPFVCAPHLIDIEVTHVLRKFVLRGQISAERGETALLDLIQFPILRWAHEPLLPGVWAIRQNVSAHDAAYISLAELLQVSFLTSDQRLAASPGHAVKIELV